MSKKSIAYLLSLVALDVLVSCNSAKTDAVAFGTSSATFTKTNYRCDKCSCKGYWGYKHGNGTYEGNCSNRDSGGHTCRHSPQHHGLRKW